MTKKDPLFDLEHMFEDDAGSSDPSMQLDDKLPFGEEEDDDDVKSKDAEVADKNEWNFDDDNKKDEDFASNDKEGDETSDNDDSGEDMNVDDIDVEDLAQDISDDLAGAIVDAFTMLKNGVPPDDGDNSDADNGDENGDSETENSDAGDDSGSENDPTQPLNLDDDDSNDGDNSGDGGGDTSDQIDAIDKQIADLQAKKAQLAGSTNEDATDWEVGGGGGDDVDGASMYQKFDGEGEYNEDDDDEDAGEGGDAGDMD